MEEGKEYKSDSSQMKVKGVKNVNGQILIYITPLLRQIHVDVEEAMNNSVGNELSRIHRE